MRHVVSFLLCAVAGAMLMLIAHFAAFLGWSMGLPYWWAYPLLYPVATIMAVRRRQLQAIPTAFAVCLLPAVYFFSLGILDSNWRASDAALIGVGITFVTAASLATWVQRRLLRSSKTS